MNENHLRAAFPLPPEPPSLDAKIDRALVRYTAARQVRRRVFLGSAVTAGLAIAFIAGPAVQAQASLSGIIRALDKQTRVRITTFTVDESGRRWPTATTTIANGDIATVDATGMRQTYDVLDKTYNLDPTIGRFIVTRRRPGGSIRLSDMLSGAAGFSIGKRAKVEQIDGVLRATIVNAGLPERYVIDADPKTELPIRMHSDALERGAWRVRQELSFDYGVPVAPVRPDLKRFPATTQQEADAAFENAMTRRTLATVPFAKGRLVIRALDVAQDGTVFVAFQTGDRLPHSWRGFAMDLKDDHGTSYVSKLEVYSQMDGPFSSPDGKIDMQVFIPSRPIAPPLPRTLTLMPNRGPKGLFRPMNPLNVKYPDGHVEVLWSPNPDVQNIKIANSIVKERLKGATCGSCPAWASRLDSNFRNPVSCEIAKAGLRSQAAIEAQSWSEAETWINEELRLKREGERQGYGPWSRSSNLEDLDKVRRAMGRTLKP